MISTANKTTNQGHEGLKYDVQCSIQIIQIIQHVKTSDQLNTAVVELGPAQPKLVNVMLLKLFGEALI